MSYRQFSTWLSAAVRRGYLPYSGDKTIWRSRRVRLPEEDLKNVSGFFNFFRDVFPLPAEDGLLDVVANDPVGWRRERSFESNPFGRGVDDAEVREFRELGRKLSLFETWSFGEGLEEPMRFGSMPQASSTTWSMWASASRASCRFFNPSTKLRTEERCSCSSRRAI